MCGIAGVLTLDHTPDPLLDRRLAAMNELQAHRGPDGHGVWRHPAGKAGFAHRRLTIIDLDTGQQPMRLGDNVLTYNGEIYNYVELREELGRERFRTSSDTEVILHAYERWGEDCVQKLRGMFAFAIWDEANQKLFCARDRFGIKPFYYTIADGRFYFASEIKALLPFVPAIETDVDGFKDYLAFQFCLDGKTLFKNVWELKPGHVLNVSHGRPQTRRYWEVFFNVDFEHTAPYFERRLQELLAESVELHLRSDVPVGAYVSGGLDSSVIATAASETGADLLGFHGKFSHGPEFDESRHARAVCEHAGVQLHELDMNVSHFIDNIERVLYHLDMPVAGPGSFPQFMVSGMAARHRKVLLGGQGGDEIFGGYTRYLIAYFEQCIKGAIDGTMTNGNFVVTYESIIPNLVALAPYKPLLQEFWKSGLFEPMDKRYFRLINRAPDLGSEVRWDMLGDYSPFDTFRGVFYGDNVGKESYFDLMTHFDFKTLLPALLHVEDRVSMAHGLESRVPLLDHPLVEFAATIPSDVKFKNGTMKHLFRTAYGAMLPDSVLNRTDKMGFPTPLTDWMRGGAREFVTDILTSERARQREFVDNRQVVERIGTESRFGRNLWGLLSLELWQRNFHDRQDWFSSAIERAPVHDVVDASAAD